MNTFTRSLFVLVSLIVLGIGLRLMYYGLQSLVGYSSGSGVGQLLALIAGIICFIAGLASGVLLLTPAYQR
jgi:predicted cobalt transporter CbtA